MSTHTYGKLIPCGHTHYAGCDPCGCDEWVKIELDTVTISISHEDAKAFQDSDGNWIDGSTERLAEACREALEAQNEYDTSPELQALLRRAALGER